MSQVEFKRDPRDGRFKLMEVNPRFWLWHGLAASLGVDFARIAYHDLLGRPAGTGDDRRQAQALGDHAAGGELPAFQRPPYVEPVFSLDDPKPARRTAGPRRQGGAAMIPPVVERRARWVLDTLGAHDLGFGDDVPYRRRAWEQVERGERPEGDDLAEAFFHLARIEERNGPRDDARPLSGLRNLPRPARSAARTPAAEARPRATSLGRRPLCRRLSHDVDIPWRWTRKGIRLGAGRLKAAARGRDGSVAWREARGLATRTRAPATWHRSELLVRADRRPRAEPRRVIGLLPHGGSPRSGRTGRRRRRTTGCGPASSRRCSALAARSVSTRATRRRSTTALIAEEKAELERLGATLHGQRYHYLRVDPHANLAPLADLGFAYDSSLGFGGAPGFRAGIAHPFRPWDLEHDRPLDLVEIPLAAMDVTLAEPRYLGLSVKEAERRLLALLDRAAEHGGGFSILWHTDRFDPATSGGWDRLYARLIDAIHARGGVCLPAFELAAQTAAKSMR